MQKIVIRNFGAIQESDIEIRNILVLIGEQASGKSTIAKLIYFFKSLGDDFFHQIFKTERENYDVTEDLKIPIRKKFYDFFGSTYHLPNFEITYYYNFENSRYLKLKLDLDKRLVANFSSKFFARDFQHTINDNKKVTLEIENKLSITSGVVEKMALERDKLRAIQTITTAINNLFENVHTSSLFTIASRETTVSYGATFESHLEITTAKTMEENRKNVFKAKEQTIDENLMIEFLQEIRRIKEVFKKYGGTFETVIKSFSQETSSFKTLLQNIQLVLKGTYKIDQYGEKILLSNEQYVYLKNASSGQKEVIRILQDAVLCILENQNAFRVIEEPEAHLFPVAQKQLVESLIFMKNYNPLNQLIITTHSPYILTVLNNLLFATRVVSNKPESLEEVATIIPQEFHIKPNEFAAYSLGNSLLQDATYCENIVNEKTGMIKQNYLDTVSDMLGGDFNFLYQLHTKNLRPR